MLTMDSGNPSADSERPRPITREECIAAGRWGEVAVPFTTRKWMEGDRLMCACPECGEPMDYARDYARHYVLTHERAPR